MNSSALNIQELTHSYGGKTVLKGLTLEVEEPPKGEAAPCICIMGGNGAGKSTLLGILSGRIRANPETCIEILGRQLRNATLQSQARSGVAASLEAARDVEPELTILSNLRLIPDLSAVPWWQRLVFCVSRRRRMRQLREEVIRTAKKIGWDELTIRLNERAGNLSYGWRKLLSCLRICMADARLILLDEPFAGLDPKKAEVLKRLMRGWSNEGRFVVFVEHIRSAAMRKIIEETASRLVLLHNGKVQLDASPSTVLDHPTFHKVYVGENNGNTQEVKSRRSSSQPLEPALVFNNLRVAYDDRPVLQIDRLAVPRGGFTLMIGPNGSGKSTLLGSVHGLGEKVHGDIRFFGKPIRRLPPHKVARLGVAIVPQRQKLFADLSVARNVRIATATLSAEDRREATSLLQQHFPLLLERRSQIAGTLSSGEQAQLALALAFIRKPQILLADELSIGLDATRTNLLQDLLQEWVTAGGTVLLAEQNYQHALERCDEVVALRSGRLIWCSKPDALTSELQTALFSGRPLGSIISDTDSDTAQC